MKNFIQLKHAPDNQTRLKKHSKRNKI